VAIEDCIVSFIQHTTNQHESFRMNPLSLFGRHRNLAISSIAIPQLMEGVQSLEVVRIEGSESLDVGAAPIFEYKVLLKTPAQLQHIPPQVLLQSFFFCGIIF
jgi:type VI secretion system secreted protein VgrG